MPEPHRRIGGVGALEHLDLDGVVVRVGMLLADVDDLAPRAACRRGCDRRARRRCRRRPRDAAARSAPWRPAPWRGASSSALGCVAAGDGACAQPATDERSHHDASASGEYTAPDERHAAFDRDLPGTGGLHQGGARGLRRRRAPCLRAVGRRQPHLLAHREARAHHRRGHRAASAARSSVSPRDAGAAGQKDRQALTRQWISLPEPSSPTRALAASAEGVRVARSGAPRPQAAHRPPRRQPLHAHACAASAPTRSTRARAVVDRARRRRHGQLLRRAALRRARRQRRARQGALVDAERARRASAPTSGACW